MKINKSKIYFVSFLYIIYSIINSILPLFFVYIFDNIIKKNYKLVIIILISQLIIYLIYILYTNILNNISAKVNEEIKNELKFNLALSINNQKAKNINSNKILAYNFNEVEDFVSNYVEGIYAFCEKISLLIFSSITLIYFNYILFILCILLSIFMYYIPQLFVKKLSEKQKNINEAQGLYLKKVKNLFYGIMNFIYANKEKNFLHYIKLINEDLKKEHLDNYNYNKFYEIFVSSLNIFSTILLCIVVYIMMYLNYVTIGVFASIKDVFNNFNQSVVSISSIIARIKIGKDIFDKMKDNIEIKEENDKEKIDKIEEISFEKFGINYETKEIIKNFSFKIEKDKKYEIIGESGTGKSSLIKAILGLIPYNGSIYLNNINLEDINMKSMYDKIEYINDENKIIYANIYDNISLFSDYSKSKIDAILSKMNLNNISKDLILSDDNISTGEKQRINLARILYNKKEFLILDEAMANIDKNNSKNISEYINSFNNGLIYITHHSNEYINFNEILNISNKVK